MKKQVKVVAAVIENEKNEILCALRSTSMLIPNMWEFPGGKVEKGENLQEALEREITEELRCEIKAHEIINENIHEYDSFIIQLVSLRAELISGIPIAIEHAKLIWLPRENLPSLLWAPADIPAVEEIMKQEHIPTEKG
ncbi:(deoxy)nucleoside triphosphate pyrophosphohydrolase [Jeotgalibacillus sp. S-D1]|uniref:(deoxy)nucleoside triphosphate pyrophosphohydrolase n=1 Tax=Jeotgalibacillus sp. S-D1 TaxID=2552189 RepID=UPI00105A813F|nr:(deoxy)nucleoside triphosphate pyrophosphohydrolase [Jeotgalibacillus sp. S-D1]TDL31963.1 (deoxy)nucleoside triphosphate pyrophosphohydrolase [Jeotgalibacillus sp. S-D1]